MLNNVNDVDWAGKGHPNIPQLLSQLASNNRYKQTDALNRLESDVVLGGGHSQNFDRGYGIELIFKTDVILHIIPFLLELIEADITTGKASILSLLNQMHHYKDMYDKESAYKIHVENIHDALWEGRGLYTELLSSNDMIVRQVALAVLMGFDEPRRSEAYELVARRFEPKIASDDS